MSFPGIKDKVLGYSSHDFTASQELAMAQKSQQVAYPNHILPRVTINPKKLYFAIGFLLTLALAFTKLSAVFFYRRVLCTGPYAQWFHIATIVTIIIVACWLVTFEILAGLECGTHFSALWDGTYAEYCSYSFPYLYGLAVSDFLLDVWILILPIPVVSRIWNIINHVSPATDGSQIISLHLAPWKKLSIIGVFLLAFV